MDYEYKKGYWETKDHKILKISDMETSHIKNTIKYLERHKDFYDIAYGDFLYESYDYEDNSELVYRKIYELQEELNKRLIVESDKDEK